MTLPAFLCHGVVPVGANMLLVTTIRSVLLPFITLLAVMGASVCAQTNFDQRIEIPLKFEYGRGMDQDTGGGSTDWHWLPLASEVKAGLSGGEAQLGFALPVKLIIEYDSSRVWPGISVPCRAWIEQSEDPERPEFYSIYGSQVGISFRPVKIHWPELSFGKDFCVAYSANGPAPLGDTFLGGIDQLEYIQLPLAEILETGGRAAARIIGSVLNGLDTAQFNFCSINLCAEGVLEGLNVEVLIGDYTLQFTGYGQEHAIGFTLPIPLQRENPSAAAETFDLAAYYHYNFYQGVGLILSLITPLELWLTPQIVDRVSSMFGGHYEPPSPSLLRDSGFYRKRIEDGVEMAKGPLSIALPIAETPDIPDLAILDVVCNPAAPIGEAFGRAYADETNVIRFTIANLGRKSTKADGLLKYALDIDGVRVEQWTRLMSGGSGAVLEPNSSTNLVFTRVLSEGPHVIAPHVTYLEIVGTNAGSPVYGFMDANTENNRPSVPIYVYPRRGTVVGLCRPNPSIPGNGIPGLLVWLHKPGFSAWTTSSWESGEARGTFRFEGVPEGDYQLDILTPTNGAPDGRDYVSRTELFHHSADDVSDLRVWGMGPLLQYQTALGRLRDAVTHQPVVGARVEYGPFAWRQGTSDTQGVFRLPRVPPVRDATCTIHHEAYESLKCVINVYQDVTETTQTWIWGYCPGVTGEYVNGSTIWLTPDVSPPVIEIVPPEAGGACRSNITVRFRITDGPWKTVPWWQWEVRTSGGVLCGSSGGWLSYEAPSQAEDYVEHVWDFSGMDDGAYDIRLFAKDQAGLETNAVVRILHDTRAPTATLSLNGGAAWTSEGDVQVAVQLQEAEPLRWQVELSNNGVDWSQPFFGTGGMAVVRGWHVADRGFVGSVTVTARVTDAAGNVAGASDSIDVDISGWVQLADGAPFYGTTAVPVAVHIVPPPSELVYYEPCYSALLTIGHETGDMARAQAFVMPTATNISALSLSLAPIGCPDPLAVRLVTSLGSTPTGGPVILAETTVDRFHVPPSGVCTLTWSEAFSIPAGVTNYLVLQSTSVSSQDFWQVGAGYSEYGNHLPRYDFVPGSGWIEAPSEPSFGWVTLAFRLFDDRRGRIRWATDGACDTEPWFPYLGPSTCLFSAAFGSFGWQSVAVQYENPFSNTLNGTYYDGIMLDGQPPIIQAVRILEVNTNSGMVRVEVTAFDDDSGLDRMEWSLDGGMRWSSDVWIPEREIPFAAPFSSVRIVVVDRAGLSSAPVDAAIPQDCFPPSLGFWINDGSLYTTQPTVTLHFAAWDDRDLSACAIGVQELTTHHSYPDMGGQTTASVVSLPAVEVITSNGSDLAILDGAYVFMAAASDQAGHCSPPVQRTIILDRRPPTLNAIVLYGEDGCAWVTGGVFMAEIEATDIGSDASIRRRVNQEPWTAWEPMTHGAVRWRLETAAVPANQHVLRVEIRDGAGNTTNGMASIKINHRPNKPEALWPSGEIGNGSPRLTGSTFSDPDGSSLGAAEFMVTRTNGAPLIWSGPLESSSYELAEGLLQLEVAYLWRVRYRDPEGWWSEWSEPVVFWVGVDSDNDGLSDSIENATGTNPYSADTDGDGIPDGIEDANHNGHCDSGESDPRLSDTDNDGVLDGDEDANHNGHRDPGEMDPTKEDTDGDGLADGLEDANRNGRWDPDLGETSATASDSDGDGFTDGQERLAETNPLDRSQWLGFTGFSVEDGGRRLLFRWQGRTDARYVLECTLSPLSKAEWKPMDEFYVDTGGEPPWYFQKGQDLYVEQGPSPPACVYFRLRKVE